MKKFYLLRSEDVNGNSGTGVVAEGIIFDNGMCAMTWNSDTPTVTSFRSIKDVEKLHSHEGRTQVIIEGRAKQKDTFESCIGQVRASKKKQKQKEQSND